MDSNETLFSSTFQTGLLLHNLQRLVFHNRLSNSTKTVYYYQTIANLNANELYQEHHVVLAFLTILALGLDYLATSVGARKLSASWRGMLGAILGGLVGLFFSIPGILLGPFIGAFLLEMAGGYEYRLALRAGAGATLGLLAGAVGKFAVCIVMITLFAANVLYHSFNS